MSRVYADISTSLDGFTTGPRDDVERPLGEGGERLHQWMEGRMGWREQHDVDAGAVLMGRRMFDVGEGPWGDDPPFRMPVFVVTHDARAPLVKDGGTTFTFVTDGVASALDRAKAAAGNKDVSIAGGANIIQQCLNTGLLDELQINLVPILLGDGKRLFDHIAAEHGVLEGTSVTASPGVTHLRFRVVR